jgi:hypothetical protein
MNTGKTIILLILIFITGSVISQNRHMTPGFQSDTLLFDGENSIYRQENTAEGCKFKVTYVEGKVTGTTDRMEWFETCQGSWIHVTGIYELKTGDMVTAEIKTGDKARLELEAPDGSVIRLGPNSSTTLDCNAKFEDLSQKISMKLVLGTIWSHVTHALGGDNAMDIQTDRAIAGVRGTTFSFEVKLENGNYTDILRTYEGSVEFSSRLTGKIDEKEMARRSQELQDDFKAGKISLEEFTKKMKELTDPATDLAGKNIIMVGAGEESRVIGNELPTGTTKITEDPDAWYLDKNFTR